MKQENLAIVKFRGKALTPRQFEILELIGYGYSNTDIALTLCVSNKTVESHIANIRTLLSDPSEGRIGDRKLVLMAKEMVDGYNQFVATNDLADEFDSEETCTYNLSRVA